MIKTGNAYVNEASAPVKEMTLDQAKDAKKDATYIVGQISSMLSFLESYAGEHPDFTKDTKQYILQSRKAVEICSMYGTRANERIMEINKKEK